MNCIKNIRLKTLLFLPIFFCGIFLAKAQNFDGTAFQKALHFADSVYNLNEFENAKGAYEYADHLQSGNAHIQQRLAVVNQKISEMNARDKHYADVLSEARQALNINDLQKAKERLEYALSLKPDGTWAQEKLTEINKTLSGKAALQAQFDAHLTKGDQYVSENKYKQYFAAKVEYEAALKLIPNDENALAKLSSTKAKIKEIDLEYKNFVASGDQLYQKNELEDAKEAFTNASKLKEEGYPKQKIDQINHILADDAAINAILENIITQADHAFDNQNYTLATQKYKEALDVLSTHQHSKDRLQEIARIIGESEAQKLAYNGIIEKANAHFDHKRYPEAKTEYENALTIFPNETLPKQRIAEIDRILSEQFSEAQKLERLIVDADALFDAQQWMAAKNKYTEALQMDAGNAYIVQRIKTIEATLAKMEKDYDALIVKSDNLFKTNKFIEALESYTLASGIKPEQSYPKEKIAEINTILNDKSAQEQTYHEALADADAAYNQKNWALAVEKYSEAIGIKPNETYPKQQLAKANKELQNAEALAIRYNDALLAADDLFTKEQWNAAVTAYQAALKIKPEEIYPAEQIKLAKMRMGDIEQLENNYKTVIAEGDAQFKIKNWTEAIAAYQTALSLKPTEIYPQTQIDKANKELESLLAADADYNKAIQTADALFNDASWTEAIAAYQLAMKTKPIETYPQQQIDKAQAELQAISDKETLYNKKVSDGDKLFSLKSWEQAKTTYQDALLIKPGETYLQSQIALCDEEIRLAQEKLEAQQSLEANYSDLILQGDAAFEQKQWNASISFYEQALTLKANEKHPKTQIELAHKEMKKIAANQKLYATYIGEGDAHLAQENWQEAKKSYSNATLLFPEELYPLQKISEIDAAVANLAQRQAEYDAAITAADAAFNAADYETARVNYETAQRVKSKETYPTQRLREIENILNAKIAAENAQKYRDFIAEANGLIAEKNYPAAIVSLKNALEMKPADDFATKKIAELQKIIDNTAFAQSEYTRLIIEADQYFNEGKYNEAINSYRAAMRHQPNETYPRKKVVEAERNLEYTPEKRRQLAQESSQRGQDAVNTKSYEAAARAYANAFYWYPEDGATAKNKLNDVIAAVETGNDELEVLTTPMLVSSNKRGVVEMDIKPSELKGRTFALFKVSGDYEENINIFLRWGRFSTEHNGTVITLVHGLDAIYYCAEIKGASSGLTWLSFVPEKADVTIETVKFVTIK